MKESEYLKQIRSFDKKVWLWLVAWFGGMGFSMWGVYLVVFNLLLLRLGFDAQYVGLVAVLFGLSSAGASMPAGIVGARFGVRRLTIVGMILAPSGFALTLSAPFLQARWWPAWLPVCVGAIGIGYETWVTNSLALFSNMTHPSQRGVAFAVMAALEPAGGFLDNLVGGLLPGAIASAFALTTDDAIPFSLDLLVPALAFLGCALAIASTSAASGAAARHDAESAGRANEVPTRPTSVPYQRRPLRSAHRSNGRDVHRLGDTGAGGAIAAVIL